MSIDANMQQPRRPSPRRGDGRTRRRPSAGQRSSDARRQRREPHNHAPQGVAIPLPVFAISLVSAIALSVVITWLVTTPQVSAAKTEAKEVREQVATLTHERDLLKEQVSTYEAAANPAPAAQGAAASSATVPEGVESPWTASGRYSSGDSVLDGEVKDFCDNNCGEGLSRDDAAFEMYKALAWADYVERDNAQEPSGPDWRNIYAHQYYENGCSGNCYEFASFLMYCLRYMGYEDAMAEAVLIELQSGSWGDHGIVFVTDSAGNPAMCDTARGTNGWMISTGAYNYTIEDVTNA